MRHEVRNAFAMAGFLIIYGMTLWLFEHRRTMTEAVSWMASSPAKFARLQRDMLVEQEFTETPEGVTDGPD